MESYYLECLEDVIFDESDLRVNLFKMIKYKYKIFRLSEKIGDQRTIELVKRKVEILNEENKQIEKIGGFENCNRYYELIAKEHCYRTLLNFLKDREELKKSYKWYKKYNEQEEQNERN